MNSTAKNPENAKEGLEWLGERVIGACIEVHRNLGPGLLESAYEECLAFELHSLGIPFERKVPLPICYKGHRLDAGYRMDLVVDRRLLLELKACETVPSLARAQVLSYLRLSGMHLGFLINFHSYRLMGGFQRFVLDLPESDNLPS